MYCRWQEQGRHGGGEVPRIGESWRGKIGDISGHRSRTRPSMVSLEPPWKVASIGTPHILVRGPPEAAKTKYCRLVWSSFGGLRGLLSRCVGCLWMQLFMAAVSVFGGRRYHRFVPICRKNRPLSSLQFIGGVVDTGEQFIGGVVDTGEQFIGGVVDTGDNIFPRCRWYRSEITKKHKIFQRQQHCQKTVQQYQLHCR